MASEKTIEQYTIKAAEARGGKAVKFSSPSFRGVPDRLVLFPGGRAGFLELKGDGGKATKLQLFWIKTLRELGFKAAVADSKQSVDAFLDELCCN
jgi:hypothetical protein